MATDDATRPTFEAAARADLRSAWLVSVLSVVWTTVTGSLGVALGVASNSVVLAAFGAVAFLDAIGSVALTYHFRHALRHDTLSERVERLAHRIVTVGLIAVGAAAVVGGVLRLVQGVKAESSVFGIALAACAVVVLAALAHRKRVLAPRVGSPALRSDGHLSAVGAAQAGVTLLGTLAALLNWQWADPAAATVVGVVAICLGVQGWTHRSGTRDSRGGTLRRRTR